MMKNQFLKTNLIKHIFIFEKKNYPHAEKMHKILLNFFIKNKERERNIKFQLEEP